MITETSKIPFVKIQMDRQQAAAAKAAVESMMFEERTESQSENMRILDECRGWYDSLYDFRRRRRRNRRYHRGDQWKDAIQDDNGDWITEEDYLKKQGKVPLKQNIIRQMVKNLTGQYRNSETRSTVLSRSKGGEEGARILTNAIQHIQDLNFLKELDARALEEFALSGMVIQKETFDWYSERDEEDVSVKNVNPNRIGFNTDIEDIRGRDLRIIFEIIDTPIEDIISVFAKSPEEEERIRGLYTLVKSNDRYIYQGLDSRNLDYLDFYVSDDLSKARMYEVWYQKSEWRTRVHDTADGSFEITNYTMDDIYALNQERIEFGRRNGVAEEDIPLIEAQPVNEKFWYVKYLTPHGHCLWEGESPFEHQEHPYTFFAYPLIDGEVWGFVEDIIDQQRYINRMIIMMDFIMSASAKGVLMVPQDAIPEGMSPEEFAEEWRSFNGVIVYKPSKTGVKPEQISANSTAVGLADMLQFQLQFINDISGIHGAIQGKEAKSGTAATLYAQEASNASTNTMDFFMSFNFFKEKRDRKILKLILQYYQEERYFAIEGEKDSGAQLYDPDKVKGKMYDLKIAQNNDTPIYRQVMNDTLMKLLEGQMIDVEVFLENSPIPHAKSILDSIKRRKEELKSGEGMNLETGAIEGAQQNPEAQRMIGQAVGKSA